ncbi:hypothetical protein SDC9_69007 [bioreactor metagenome]|uniref:Fido domain-containing protein n=1 Tax=bioreactor metagenome TaxID=1076179 RepID=A0A644Y1Z9_9ZZZZ
MNHTEKEALFKKIDSYAAVIKSYRPLSKDEINDLDAYFRIGVTYSSNALEGNSLTLSETKVLLEDGITVGGKPIRDCYEATGHARAYDFMLELARSTDFTFTEDGIKRLHYLFYYGIDPEKAGQYRKGQVFITGTEYVPPKAEEVSFLMAKLVDELNAKRDKLHPVELAAYGHRRLVDIHPFQDGNGRTARLLMNLVLVNKGYCIASIPPILRHDYITALQQAQRSKAPSDAAFIKLIAECEIEAQKDYCRMFHIKLSDLTKDVPER